MVGGLAGLAVAWQLLASVTAFADPGAAVVLYGPGGPDLALESRALATYHLQGPRSTGVPSVRHVSTVVASVPEVTVEGASEVLTCKKAEPVRATPLVADLGMALEQVLYVQTEEATNTLERLESSLPCLVEVLPRSELSRIYFLRAVALTYAEEEDAALESFRQALVVSPMMDWDARFPPGPEQAFRQAIQAALRTQPADLEVAPHVSDGARVYVDGEQFAAEGGTTTLGEGRHLIQWTTGEGATHTRVLVVGAGDRLTVYGQRDVSMATVRGEGCGPCVERSREALSELAWALRVPSIGLVEQGPVDLLHTFEVESAAWSLTDAAAVSRMLRDRRIHRAGTATTVAGGGLLLGGTAVSLVSYVRYTDLYHPSTQDEITDEDEWEAKRRAGGRAWTLFYGGLVAAGVGGVTLVTGLGVMLDAGPGGLSLELRFP